MKSKKIISLFILIVAVLCMLSSSVSAYNLIGGRFTRGVGNTCYYGIQQLVYTLLK